MCEVAYGATSEEIATANNDIYTHMMHGWPHRLHNPSARPAACYSIVSGCLFNNHYQDDLATFFFMSHAHHVDRPQSIVGKDSLALSGSGHRYIPRSEQATRMVGLRESHIPCRRLGLAYFPEPVKLFPRSGCLTIRSILFL